MALFNLKHSLYWRLSLAFFLMLAVVATAYIIITFYSSNKYYNEITQRLNADVAEYLIKEVAPFKDGEVNAEGVGIIMHSMMAVNPGIEVYLVNPEGEILKYVVLESKVKLSRISLEPIHQFIANKGSNYILGDDPRNPGGKTIFSATPVLDGDRLQGYVYIVLASEKFEKIESMFFTSYWIKLAGQAFVLTLIVALLVGLVLIWLLVRNLQVIIKTVEQFKNGNLHARVPEKDTRGELGVLSSTFNSMADTILANIDELKKVDSLRRELIANVSHDLRNPLAIIQGYIETMKMKRGQLSEAEELEYMDIILDNSQKLNRLVGDLFELSKLESGQIQLALEPFYIQELINDTTRKNQLLGQQKHIQIQTDIDDGLPMVVADIAKLDLVIQNLIENALKYTPENGSVSIRVSAQKSGVEVSIQNTGKGIPEKDLPHIFDRYYKVDKAGSGVEGTGLGLAIVKKILDVHQSSIQVSSVPDKSTSFRFVLPAA